MYIPAKNNFIFETKILVLVFYSCLLMVESRNLVNIIEFKIAWDKEWNQNISWVKRVYSGIICVRALYSSISFDNFWIWDGTLFSPRQQKVSILQSWPYGYNKFPSLRKKAAAVIVYNCKGALAGEDFCMGLSLCQTPFDVYLYWNQG